MRESATKKVIAESLKRRMLRHNLTDITVTDLCTDAEINRRTFYRHFTDKYQLVTWIYENGFQKAIGDDEPGLFDLFGRVCTYLYARRRRSLHPGRCTCGRTSWGGGRSSAMRGSTL